jgi:hypothetical protein
MVPSLSFAIENLQSIFAGSGSCDVFFLVQRLLHRGEVISRALCGKEYDLAMIQRSGHVERAPVLKSLTSVSSKNKVQRSRSLFSASGAAPPFHALNEIGSSSLLYPS